MQEVQIGWIEVYIRTRHTSRSERNTGDIDSGHLWRVIQEHLRTAQLILIYLRVQLHHGPPRICISSWSHSFCFVRISSPNLQGKKDSGTRYGPFGSSRVTFEIDAVGVIKVAAANKAT